jgi:Uma2 family endonuclease
MVPLPEHERAKVIIGDLVKILLDELDLNWESFGSTTIKREEMTAGVEPDDCFYIERTPTISKLIVGETLRYTVLRLLDTPLAVKISLRSS